jgi:copper chaperone CopZ
MSTTQTYDVTGMTCGHCVASVEAELRAVPGVSGVTVDLTPGGTSQVTVTSEGPLTLDDVAAAIDEAGYALASPRDLPLA